MTGGVLIYCKGERVLATPIGWGWLKCTKCGEVFRSVTDA